MSLPRPDATRSHWFILAAWLVFTAAALFYQLGNCGMLGPDEPRYASIGRAMAESGDWVTPRLWGAEWFEKPALSYWLTAAATKAGLQQEWAARAPVAALSLLFLALYAAALTRLVGRKEAAAATFMLASSAGWLAYSHVAVTDLPLAVFFNLALIGFVLRLNGAGAWSLVAAGVAAGLALLAKGLVAGVLLAPLAWFFRKQWKDLAAAAGLALLVAGPWYAAVTAVNGWAFVDEFFIRHHFSRFASDELRHVQPFWFYIPVIVGLVFPWCGLVVNLPRELWKQDWARVFGVVMALGFVFFSSSTNKLPGYVLPLVPLLVALIATASVRYGLAGRALAVSALLLSLMPVIASALPGVMLSGITKAPLGGLPWQYVVASLPVAFAAWLLARSGRSLAALALVAVLTLSGAVWVKLSAWPVLDQIVSARGLSRKVKPHEERICVESLHRSIRYGLNYYTRAPLPDCEIQDRAVHLVQPPGGLPSLKVVRPAGPAPEAGEIQTQGE